jgi:Lrp/AsnC family transcriptional regulator, regulator for asnA, asnC and gidA
MEIDKVERQIILLLQQNGRMSYVEMAEHIGVAEGTVRRKVNRLLDEGIITIAAVANPHVIGFDSPAIISIKTETGKVTQVAEELSRLPGVRFVALTTGSFDLIMEGYWANNQELSQFLTRDLAKVQGIREYNTSLVLRILKQAYDWGVPGRPDMEKSDILES